MERKEKRPDAISEIWGNKMCHLTSVSVWRLSNFEAYFRH